eukprot:763509-Hanusia_phi.AAC.4
MAERRIQRRRNRQDAATEELGETQAFLLQNRVMISQYYRFIHASQHFNDRRSSPALANCTRDPLLLCALHSLASSHLLVAVLVRRCP